MLAQKDHFRKSEVNPKNSSSRTDRQVSTAVEGTGLEKTPEHQKRIAPWLFRKDQIIGSMIGKHSDFVLSKKNKNSPFRCSLIPTLPLSSDCV
jgi:hypothetical protein